MFTRLYLHIPFCRCKCPYCAFVSQEYDGALNGYADLLLMEMRLAACEYAPQRPLESIYFGGGTPSLLEPVDVARIIEGAAESYGLSDQAEITLEANPGTVDLERLSGFCSAGVNRLSLGVQSLDDRMLSILGRIHTAQQARDACSIAREAGFTDIGIDLIHALPGQTAEMWRTDLEKAIQLSPEHISIYGLTVEERTPFAGRYPEESSVMPDEELAAGMFETADDLLKAAGYEHYEIANYARTGFRSQHNSGYWRRDGYLGLGAGAHSFLRDSGYGIRCSNESDLKRYSATIRQGCLARQDITPLSRTDAMAEFMFLGLRMADGVEFSVFEREFEVSFESIYGKVLGELIPTGLLNVDAGRVSLTRRGMLLSNQVFARFL
jgi:oxygen-independent coproporphyrinogen III oxidase